MIEKLLIEHCSETLASLKNANMFAIRHSSIRELKQQIGYWNQQMEEKGITLLIMKRKPGWALIYVCRKSYIQKKLQVEEVAEFLADYGYLNLNIEAALEKLKCRLNEGNDFPHEIGVFLDYPIGDVKGFIQNAGSRYKCKGCWKVYCNECETAKLFAMFAKCRDEYKKLWNSGVSIMNLTVAA